jgi:hypothetical protein
MAAAGYTPISLYYSTTAAAQPLAVDLVDGELAINITDGKLYYKDNGGTVQVIAGTGGTGIVAGSNTQIQFNNSGTFGASANLTWDGTALSTTGLTASSTVTLSGGTANGVGYLNASKVLTTGTALTFDGTNLTNLGGTVRALAAATQDALQIQGRAGGTSSYITTLTPGTLTASNTLTLPVGTTTLAGLGTTQTFTAAQTFSSTVTMSGTTTNIALGTSQTSGTWTAGGAAQTGTITLDQSTKTHTLAIGTGATESGLTKTINIGTGGVATSTTAITIGSTNGTTITLNGTVNATTVNVTTLDLTNLEVTNIKAKDGTASASIADSTGVMTIGSSVLTTTDINGGTIDGTTIGGASAAAGTFTTATATTGNITTVNATTVDTTNVEVTNIKAKDGTAAMSIADSTGIVTVSTQLQVDNLNVSGNTISSTDTNGNIVLAPNGTGDVQVDADTLRVGDSGAAATITTNGAGNLTISTNAGTNSGTIVINQGTNGNIEVAPNGTGDVYLTSDTVRIGDSNANATLTTNGTGDLILNTNSGTNSGSITIADGAGGDITATPNGNGSVVITNSGTSNALRITQTGSGNALLVEDSSNPDASPFVIDAGGNLIVGNTTQSTGVVTGGIQVQGSGANGSATNLQAYSASTGGTLEFDRSRGSIGTHTVVQSGDRLGRIFFSGSDGAAFIRGAEIYADVDGTPGTNDMPGRLVFATTADGASSPTERVRINSAGLTTVGYSAASGAALTTAVAAKLYSSNTTYTDSATAASGTVTHGTINSFDNPAIAASNASVTYTNASTVYIDGAPTAGSNVTITNPYSLYVNGGTVYFGGTVSAADPIVQQTDIGTAPNEIPLNQYLGALAYENSEWVAPQVGSGITGGTGTICKTSFATQGGIKVMQILIDLTGLNSGGTAGDIIGVNGTSNPCYIAQIPSTYTVLGGRMTCLETPAGGDTDIDLYSATEGTGTEDTDITTLTETQIINAGTQSIGTVTYFAADPAANTYFYLVGQGTSNATYTAGRFLIEVFGA